MSACPYCKAELPYTTGGDVASEFQMAACHDCLNACVMRSEDGDLPEPARLEGTPPVADLAPPGSVMDGVLGTLNEAIADLPVLPAIPQRILGLIHDPITSMSDLAEVVNEDSAIAMKVLRISNSVLYKGTQEVTDLQVACARLGMKNLANIVHAVANGNLYRTPDPAMREIIKQLWSHALATAHCADKIAAQTPQVDQRTTFIGGLVHDVGKLVLFDAITKKYRGNVGRLKESPEILVKVMDQFRSIAGLHVVLHWKMPQEFAFTTFFNSAPSRCPDPKWIATCHVLALASDMADACGFRVGGGDGPAIIDHASAQALGINQEELNTMVTMLPETLDMMMESMGAL